MIVAVIGIAGGTTAAYLLDETTPLQNSFDPVFVECEVEEVFDKTTKSNVTIKNTGEIDAYIRAVFVVTWVASDGSIYSTAPARGVDYELVLGASGWEVGSDGFYYYTSAVAPGASTSTLIDSLTVVSQTPPEGHKLSVHVAATAIQSTPAAAVENAWGVTVDSDGTLNAP